MIPECKKPSSKLRFSLLGFSSFFRKSFLATPLKVLLSITVSLLLLTPPLVANATGGISFDNVATSGWVSQASGWSFSYTMGSASGGFLIAYFFTSPSSNQITAVSYGGVSMTLLGRVTDAEGNGETAFYLKSPPTGANNFVTTQGGTFNVELRAVSYTGVDSTGAPDATAMTSGTTVSPYTLPITTVSTGDWLVAIARGGDNVFYDTTNAMTNRANTGGVGLYVWDSNGSVGAAGSHNAYFVSTGDARERGTTVFALKPATTPTVSAAIFPRIFGWW